jgi:carbamoyl-phosphate synthase large subunit
MGVAVKEVEKIYVGSPTSSTHEAGGCEPHHQHPDDEAIGEGRLSDPAERRRLPVPYITTVQAARAAAQAIEIAKGGEITIKPLDEYHREVR